MIGDPVRHALLDEGRKLTDWATTRKRQLSESPM
jgi:hypothetical protein